MEDKTIIITTIMLIVMIIFSIIFKYPLNYEPAKVEDIDNIEKYCEKNSECQTPIEYLIQSNCPFGSLCIENKCRVVCPLTYHDLNPELSKSYLYSCQTDKDCDCKEREKRTIECKCVNNECFSVEE